MIYQFGIRIFLSVIALDPDPSNKDDSQLLLISRESPTVGNWEFPYEYLTRNSTTKDVATKMLEDLTGVTTEWALLFPFGIVENVDPGKTEIDVLFCCFIPGVTKIRKEGTFWASYKDLSDSENNVFTKKLGHECIWRGI